MLGTTFWCWQPLTSDLSIPDLPCPGYDGSSLVNCRKKRQKKAPLAMILHYNFVMIHVIILIKEHMEVKT